MYRLMSSEASEGWAFEILVVLLQCKNFKHYNSLNSNFHTVCHFFRDKLTDHFGGSACQETSMRDTANKCSLELCASIVLLFLDGCSEWYVSVVF
jgi:hypothetical protein